MLPFREIPFSHHKAAVKSSINWKDDDDAREGTSPNSEELDEDHSHGLLHCNLNLYFEAAWEEGFNNNNN